ncbi:MAG: M20/M25/M40 family metallo-hydrolase [Longimicrobiales bacterium]
MIRRFLPHAAVLVATLGAASVRAQTSDADAAALASWTALDAATGYETRTSPALAAALGSPWTADRWGNVVARIGSGAPRRVVACALDRPAYAASQITEDGYLRVHRIGGGSDHPLWDQAHEAQQVRVLTAEGPVAGVVARSNGHFAAQHRLETAVVGADDLWIDVGARSADEVRALGIGLLDPVVRHLPPWPMAGAVAGPGAGGRVGCAAVVSVARSAAAAGMRGETRFVLSAQEVFGWVGLGSLVARGESVDELVLVATGAAESVARSVPTDDLGRVGRVFSAAGLSSVRRLAPRVDAPGSHMEVVALDEARRLRTAVAEAVGVTLPAGVAWVAAPAPAPLRAPLAAAELDEVARTLTDLVERHGTPSHEWAVRRYVLERLPPWAREAARVDDMGNIMVEVGPERDTTVFMAHLDEVGYSVASIDPDGTVVLDREGGAVGSAWEGQTALLHVGPADAPSSRTGTGADASERWKRQSLSATAPPPIRGVFLTRMSADRKDPGALRAWFGLDRAALEARGVGRGASVTSHKEGLRLGATRFTARALDDRAGTTALLLAVQALDPQTVPAKVVFTWSVHEEGGLVGAAALARRYASSTRRIYSVDTFVSSDTPLESPHFAFAPLGDGPVLRAIENSSVSPPTERARVQAAAAAAGIPLQLGLTQGGTDGTQFTFWGAPNQGLSWPGRYSHSPGEVLDLEDLAHLRDLILALASGGDR